MWIRTTIVCLASMGLAGCGVAAGGYGEVSRDYRQAAYTPHTLDDGDALFEGAESLALDSLVAAVLERNPSVELARQGWREALTLHPRATSFEDPTVGLSVAPLSFFDADVKIGFGAQVTQPLPYPGKRDLRGSVALAEAEAAREDYRSVRQRLALMAARLYYRWFTVERGLEINGEHIELLEQYGRTIDVYLSTGKAFQDDALEIDIDLAELARQRLTLESERDVTRAQLNALLHRRLAARLPAPPRELPELSRVAGTPQDFRERALDQRPELRAIGSRERGAEAGVKLADRAYYPDLRLTGTYNRMWPMFSHQLMVGLSINLPVMRGQRGAAVDAARARQSRHRADRARAVDDVLEDVETSLRRVEEADATAALYRERVLPAARGRVEAVRIGLDAGRTSFLEVIRAERKLRALHLAYTVALAESHRRRAELDWAVGNPAGGER